MRTIPEETIPSDMKKTVVSADVHPARDITTKITSFNGRYVALGSNTERSTRKLSSGAGIIQADNLSFDRP